uniref:Endonuclease/exonuclease/phosphatase domain-containing protein n=1 Tax=Aegilops tauschii TaxID=37682 RepID=M8ALE3_AEGTA
MGRELSMANVSIGGVTLVLGTSHLESPRREAPWWDHDMNRNKRAAQAKASLEWLGGSRNAIFCGDMNWDDKIDGTFPLPDGWADAWAQLKPDERWLDVQGIEMVGKEPMPGVSYEEKSRSPSIIPAIVPVTDPLRPRGDIRECDYSCLLP